MTLGLRQTGRGGRGGLRSLYGLVPQASATRGSVSPTVRYVPLFLRLSFLLFTFTLPLESLNVSLGLGPISLARVSGLAVFGLSLINFERIYSVPPFPIWWFLGYLLIYAVSGLFILPVYTSSLFRGMFTLVQLLVLFWIASVLLQDEKFARITLLVYALGASLLTIAVKLGLPGFTAEIRTSDMEDRLSAVGYDPNYLGMLLAMAAVIMTGLILGKKTSDPWDQDLLPVLMLIVLALLIQTGSRTALASFVIGVLCYALPSGLTRRKMVAGALISVRCWASATCFITQRDTLSRWSRTLSEGDSAGRNVIFAVSAAMIFERPIFGWGPVQYRADLSRRLGEGFIRGVRDTHNMVLHLLLEVGLFGAGFFFMGLALCGRAAWKSRGGGLGIMPLALLLMLLVFLQFQPWMTSKLFWLVLSLCVGAAKGLREVPTGGDPLQPIPTAAGRKRRHAGREPALTALVGRGRALLPPMRPRHRVRHTSSTGK